MRTVLNAVAWPPEDRAARWRETLTSLFGGLDVRLERVPDERDRLTIWDAGPVQVIESRSGPGRAERAAVDVRRGDPDRFLLFVNAAGTNIGEQNGHRTTYRPGDLGLVDLSRPMRCTFTAREAVMISYPSWLSPLRPEEVSRLAGVRIHGRSGTAALLSRLVRQLPQDLADDTGAAAQVVTATLDLLHVVLAEQLGRPDAASPLDEHRALREQCVAFIEGHLGDPNLSPSSVAAAHHVSLRHLQRLFEGSGDGIAGLIRRRRLDRCRRDLLDPGLAGRSVAAVGARWGFGDAAHFSRLFKRAYGWPPAEFRRGYAECTPQPVKLSVP